MALHSCKACRQLDTAQQFYKRKGQGLLSLACMLQALQAAMLLERNTVQCASAKLKRALEITSYFCTASHFSSSKADTVRQ